MTDLIRLLVEVLTYLWPFRQVAHWQHGVCYILGRYVWTVPPGCWPVVPYFTDVRPVDMVPAIYGTPLQTITLKDGRALTYSATVTAKVFDAAKALNDVDHWPETLVEMVAGMISERLAGVDPARFDAGRGVRARLLEELREELDKGSVAYGVNVQAVRFANFAVVETLRLLTEPATFVQGTRR